MFALTHSDLDEKTIKLLQAHQAAVATPTANAKPQEVQESAIKAADATVHSEVPSGPNIELADKVDDGSAQTAGTVCQEPVSAQVSGKQGTSIDITFHAHQRASKCSQTCHSLVDVM